MKLPFLLCSYCSLRKSPVGLINLNVILISSLSWDQIGLFINIWSGFTLVELDTRFIIYVWHL